MLLRQIKSDGLAQLSYLLGDGGEAAVIDPRRDCEIYVEMARAEGLEIAHVFETHRNEDLISGAPVLAGLTGAKVHHGPNPAEPVRYAETVREGESFDFGALRLSVLETPGHTDDHLAFVLHDSGYPDSPVGVFTGDALFVGDVGRTDFYPERAEEVAGLLYDSLRKLLALGDQAIVYPAHGAGSVCGSGMASREFSTLGHERRNNPRLRKESRDAFIRAKLAEKHYIPPYFKEMERLNVEGGEAVARPSAPRPLSLEALASGEFDRIVDLRTATAFAGAHWPGALALPLDMLSAFAGWFLKPEESLALIADDPAQAETAITYLARIGFDRVAGVHTGLVAAVAAGKPFGSLEMVDTGVVAELLAAGRNDWTLLDVRAAEEVEKDRIEGSRHIYLGELARRFEELDPARRYSVMCASGLRATIGASWLKAQGFEAVDVYLGSMGAWRAAHPED